MEAALAQLEEYSAHLAQVEEALKLDPANDALQELLTEIANGIEATEAQITLQGTVGEIGRGAKAADSASDYSDNEAADSSVSDTSDDSNGYGAKEDVLMGKVHYPGITSAAAAGGWQKRTEMMEVDETASSATDRIAVPLAAQASGSFGDWERFTKGVGSKLLSRMGYRQGRGLGSKGDGIVAPLSAGVAPRGTHGLGFEKKPKKRRRGGKRGRAAKATAAAGGGGSKAQRREELAPADTFDFLNKTLNRDKAVAAQSPSSAVTAKSEGELRQQVFSDHEKKIALDRQAARLEASLERNKKDASLTAIIKTQLSAVRQQSLATTQRQANAGAKLRDEEERKKGFRF